MIKTGLEKAIDLANENLHSERPNWWWLQKLQEFQKEDNNDTIKSNSINLFLDDLREPEEAFDHTNEGMFEAWQWTTVRNYEEFTKWIQENGLPEFISFDHDLAEEHYTPKEYWHDYEVSRAYQDSRQYTIPNGLDCAKWLKDHCNANNLDLPAFYCHSMNPVGKDRIIEHLTS